MFLMSSKITVGDYTNIKPNAATWKCGVSNFRDTASISLPLSTYVRNKDDKMVIYPDGTTEKKVFDLISTNQTVFSEGEKVEIMVGYNGTNTRRFLGFVKRINFGKMLTLECEGYSYQLKDKIFTKTYTNTTVRDILSDLTKGKDIKLSNAIPIIPLKNVIFKNCPGLKVLEWLQKECYLSVYFDFDTLYVGASKFGLKKDTIKLQIGWNAFDDPDLKKDITESNIIIHVVEKDTKGKVKRIKSEQRKYSTTKDVKIRHGLPDAVLKEIANELQKLENFSGYKGDVTCLLIPTVEKSNVIQIISNMFPDMNGFFFVEAVEGKFDESNDTQTLTLRYYGNVDGTGN